jgi:hypothetical protein
MRTRKTSAELERLLAHENPIVTEMMVAGTASGAAVGLFAGPPGVLAGSIIGTVIGLALGNAMEVESERKHQHEEELDEDIGVIGGDIGAAKPGSPPARIGAFSCGSMGVGRPSQLPSEGPMQTLDEEG